MVPLRSTSTTAFLVLALLSYYCWAQKEEKEPIAVQIQERIYERVDSFITLPMTTLDVFSDFFDAGGFPNELQATDRDLARKYLISLAKGLEHTSLKPFYGLENGYLLGYWHSDLDLVPILVHREPGNSKFTEDDLNLGIYWNACVDQESGEQETCQMGEGELYVSCVDDCALVKCTDLGGSLASDGSGIVSTDEEVKWCLNYRIEKYQDRGIGDNGFVPMTSHCIDKLGDLSQTPGKVLVETPDGVIEDGVCTFGSGKMVNRTLEGPFAFCQTVPSGICKDTYIGAYKSRNYDPRKSLIDC